MFLKLAILCSFRTRVDDVSGLLIETETVGEDVMRKKKKVAKDGAGTTGGEVYTQLAGVRSQCSQGLRVDFGALCEDDHQDRDAQHEPAP